MLRLGRGRTHVELLGKISEPCGFGAKRKKIGKNKITNYEYVLVT